MQQPNNLFRPPQVKLVRPAPRPQYYLVVRRPRTKAWPRLEWPGRYLGCSNFVMAITLVLATLAFTISVCAFSQTAFWSTPNDSVALRSALARLGRTPLPTLTPTASTGQLAGTPPPSIPANGPAPVMPPSQVADPLLSAAIAATSTAMASLGLAPSFPGLNPGGFAPAPGNSGASSADGFNLPTVAPGASPPLPVSTPIPVNLPTLPASAPTATALPAPTATLANPPTPTVAPPPANVGWSFASVRVYPDQDEGMLLYGNLINDTDAPQELEVVTGAFYDGEGRLIADETSTYDYWPVNVVPPGGRIPFELTVFDVSNAANYNLTVEAQPSQENTRQDFEFQNVSQRTEDGDYCLQGELRNSGNSLGEYLVIVAILYDGQGNMVNFDYYDEYNPESIQGDETSKFEICVPPPNQDVANYELRAWGR